ncbi:MAG TPA: hypothetical protein VF658_19475 [Pyrinomonadaceae bacterium]|jgi:hypothetical protein
MNPESPAQAHRSRLTLTLWLLLFLFVLRVVGQLLVALGWGGFLPPMSEWQSGLLSYPWLLLSQAVVIILYGKVCLDFTRGAGFFSKARRRAAVYLLIFGALYFTSMVLRYILTMALYPQRRWTGQSIPVIFHLVLATFILLVGRDYYVRSTNENALGSLTMDDEARCRAMSIGSLTAGALRARSGKSRM